MSVVAQQTPPLEAGDNLTRDEFLRRWEAQPEIKFAELIGGVVRMPSPVPFQHGNKDNRVATWLGVYAAHTPGCDAAKNTTTLLLDDVPQPDANLLILPEYGGASRMQGNYLAGVPELLAEISGSSASFDLYQKLELYQSAGVPEYIVVLLHEKEIRWHILVDGAYQLLQPDRHGVYRSRVFPGLWLDAPAFFRDDMRQVLAKLNEGLQSPEHQAFVDRLAQRKNHPR